MEKKKKKRFKAQSLYFDNCEFVFFTNNFTSCIGWENRDTFILGNCANSNVSGNFEQFFSRPDSTLFERSVSLLCNDASEYAVRFFLHCLYIKFWTFSDKDRRNSNISLSSLLNSNASKNIGKFFSRLDLTSYWRLKFLLSNNILKFVARFFFAILLNFEY